MKEIRIAENEADQRIDRFVKKYLPEVPLGMIYKYLRTKKIKVNGKKVQQNYRLQLGDRVMFYLDTAVENHQVQRVIQHYPREFGIVYEDEHLLVVDKPAGLLVHPDEAGPQNTLDQQVISYLISSGAYCPEEEKTFQPAPSNRLDRNTSGIILFGKDYATVQALNEMIREQRISKYYLALVKGQLPEGRELKGYLVKDERTNQVSVSQEKENGSLSIHTRYRVQQSFREYTLLEVELITGRSHQIRAHFASIGHPIIGDPKYGDVRVNREVRQHWHLKSQFLHAYKVVFDRSLPPVGYLTGKAIIAPLPLEMQKIVEQL